MNRIAVLILIPALLLIVCLAGCSTASVTPTTGGTAKVVMLFDSPLSDDAFALSCLKGAEKAKAESGMGLFVCISGSDSESAQLLDQLAASERYGLIISIGASQSANVTQNAVKYPDQKFALVDGDIADKSNVSPCGARYR
jgi:basic membrane protein A